MNKLIEAHRFFIKESSRYLRDKPMAWKTKEMYIPVRGSMDDWYYPLSLRNKLYYPVAYIKFMWLTIRGL